MNRIFCGDCLKELPRLGLFDCIFADIPDNIGLKYKSYKDKKTTTQYLNFITDIIDSVLGHTKKFWLSFNSRWTAEIGHIIYNKIQSNSNLMYKPCIQTFTFGRYNDKDLSNNHRPIWRIYYRDAKFFPDNIREPSWRLLNNDKRANPNGRIPSDVFNIPRVTGNSKQRKRWIPTQLNIELLKKIIKFSVRPNGTILDLCGGSGSMLTAAKEVNRYCDIIEIDRFYCEQIAKEHSLIEVVPNYWESIPMPNLASRPLTI